MRSPSRQMAGVIAASGSIVAVVTLLLFYQFRDAVDRSETFSFTVWFVTFQVFVFFGGLTLTAYRAGATSTAVPVRLAFLTTVPFYNAVALATVGLFNFVLLPQQYASPNAYYTIAVAETLLWLTFVVFLRVVDITHHAAHSEAATSRANIDAMLVTCDRIRAATDANGWPISQSLRMLADQIRFSEGLRRNESLATEVNVRLTEVEAIVMADGDYASQKTLERIVKEISIMTTRRG